MTNSRYLKWFNDIEKALWSFFKLFENLCDQCAKQTLIEVSNRSRKGQESWCCCMIDNQVHDNWDALNPIQQRNNPDWYEPLRREKGVRMPGNGPCPALSDKGCLLKKHRPITCTTQLCSKMLMVLKEVGIINNPTHSALQIEDIVKLPDIMPGLYGTRKNQKINPEEVNSYISGIRQIRNKLKAIPDQQRQKVVDEIIPTYFSKR